MELTKLSLTLPLASAPPSADALITVFHRWIQRKTLAEELLIDVVDYRHVHQGPGILLVAHDTHYSVGEHGVRAASRRPLPGTFETALPLLYLRLLTVAALLEGELSLTPLSFASDRLVVEALDRLRAPSAPDLAAATGAVLLPITGPVELQSPGSDPRGPVLAAARAAEKRSLRQLIERI